MLSQGGHDCFSETRPHTTMLLNVFLENVVIEQSICFSSGSAQVDSTIHNTKGVITAVASLLPLCNKLVRKVRWPENVQNFLSQIYPQFLSSVISCTLLYYPCKQVTLLFFFFFLKCLCIWIPVRTKQCATNDTFTIFIGETMIMIMITNGHILILRAFDLYTD